MEWTILVQGGPSVAFLGLLIFVGRLIYTGGLVTRATVTDLKENFKQQIERERSISADWQKAATMNTDALMKLTSQNDKLLESQKTVESFINSIAAAPTRLSISSRPAQEAIPE